MLEVTIIGHLGKDAEVKEFNGEKYISFSVAHSESYKDQNGTKVEKTVWVSVLRPMGTGNLAQYLTKGQLVMVRGNLSIKPYKAQDGSNAVGINCRAEKIQLLGSSKPQGSDQQPEAQHTNQATQEHTPPPPPSDDLPF